MWHVIKKAKILFSGPGTHLQKRLERGDKPINPLDSACLTHDIAYSKFKDLENQHAADRQLARAARGRIFAKDAGIGERAAATAVAGLIGIKEKVGMGAPRKRARKCRARKIPIASRQGGFLQYVAPLAAAAGAAAGLYKTVHDVKQSKKVASEKMRHELAMEKIAREGKGLRLKPYKRGKGL